MGHYRHYRHYPNKILLFMALIINVISLFSNSNIRGVDAFILGISTSSSPLRRRPRTRFVSCNNNDPAITATTTTAIPCCHNRSPQLYMIGTGFSFDDGEQVLVSVQKPLGILLEQDDDELEGEGAGDKGGGEATAPPVIVAEVDPSGNAGLAGVREGDILVAVQNASVEAWSLESVMDLLGQAPRVVNLRFLRR